MKSIRLLSAALVAGCLTAASAAEPLRVFVRGGAKSHGPEGNGVHEHARFLGEASQVLSDRGIVVSGGMEFPTAERLAKVDVLVMYAQEGGHIPKDKRPGMDAFLKRGGGVLLIHTAAVPEREEGSGEYLKKVVGGTWVWGQTKWLEGPMHLYYVDRTHPITTGVANFDVKDEIYYDMDLSEDIQVLAASYTPNLSGARRNDPRGHPGQGRVTVYDLAPQIWAYENQLDGGQPYRAIVSLPGHLFGTFELPHYRAVLLRSIAWVGKRANVDEFVLPEEKETLLYPEGGPSRPAASLSQLTVHPEFKVSQVASEPLINNPMNIDWDPQGRLWVAETPEYPDGRWANDKSDLVQRWVADPERKIDGKFDRKAHDKISILTDTNGDGVMDKKQVFHEGLELVTSLVFHQDGVIVAQAPEILFLRDTDGDDKADKIEVLYKNLGHGDTHAVLNNLRRGFDGWIYGTHGYSGSQHVMSGDGRKDFGSIGSGVVRFKPDGSAIEQYSSKGGNTWGLQISWDNEVFWTQPTSGDLLMHTVVSENVLGRGRVPGTASYQVVSKSIKTYPPIAYEQLPYVQIDQVGRFTAAAGTVIYDGGAWPEKWNYDYFTTEPTINLVHHQIVEPAGVTFTSHKAADREETEFITGKDYWFRPIEVRVGPDGAVYLIDFYNQAVIHNDTRGPKHGPRNAAIRPDRDHYYGRVYRIDHRQAKPTPVPNLAKASTADLVRALESANRHTRMTAVRLLAEQNATRSAGELKQLVRSGKPAESRVAALWALAHLGELDAETEAAAAADSHGAIRKNVMMIAAAGLGSGDAAKRAVVKSLNDADPRVRLEALKALGAADVSPEVAQALVQVYPQLGDNWSRSAFFAAAARSPTAVLDAALAASPVNNELIGQLTALLGASSDAGELARLVISLANRPSSQDAAKQAALESLAAGLKPDTKPAASGELQGALTKLLGSSNFGVAAAALPLAVSWGGDSLAGPIKEQVNRLTRALADASSSDASRLKVASALLGARSVAPEGVTSVGALLGSTASKDLQAGAIEALGGIADDAAATQLINAYPKLIGELQGAALNQLLKRSSWSLALLGALESGKINPDTLGPANIHRLRIHPDAGVAARANVVIDQLRGPVAKEKAQLVANLVPEVEKPGNVEQGKALYVAACATCHQFGELGNLVGPPLTGMGAHGPAELLGHILDPNREVDLSFVAWSVETRDGEIYDGVVTRENNTMVALRNAAGEVEIAKSNIKDRRNTGRSLMPEGFESLGAEGLRDLLAFMTADTRRFRILDLREVANGSSTEGIYASRESRGESVKLKRFGTIQVGDVPFDVLDPKRVSGGRNLVTLKGRFGMAPGYPEEINIPVNAEANRIHFLSGIGGWAWPYDGDRLHGKPVVKVTVHYTGGGSEEMTFKNGVEYADYINNSDVPGSKPVADLVNGGQVRYFSKDLGRTAKIERITLSSFNNEIAPTFVGITVEKADGSVQRSASAAGASAPAAAGSWGAGVKALLIGGGASHDYEKWFNDYDSSVLRETGKYSPRYFEPQDVTVSLVKEADVILLSANKAFPDPAVREAIFAHVEAGRGLVLLHPGLWYNWKDWPEFNKVLAGGGSRGHDRLGEFEVKVTQPDHPLVKNVPAIFAITDELYYYVQDPDGGTPIEVLAI
ncbi:MAG TPA: hypothetical protein DCY13_13585, partial [Verrucomicrobiales bacterium]|nr:hypothetical protein [Verrucomicrobiales bacterium]